MGTPSRSEIAVWARQAGDILRQRYGRQHTIGQKGRIDIVTEADHLSEDYLMGQIQTAYPGHTVITEERGAIAGQEDACWYIDPLDGTINFAHGVPIFSVSIAFAAAGELVLGVVYDPMRDECFQAERGKGAWLNGEPLHVSQASVLLHSLLVTGFPYDRETMEHNLQNFVHLVRQTQGVRRLGSAALDLCYVAAGRFDGYWEMSLQPYDLAAGALIAREAGARVTDMHGGETLFRPPCSIVAANPALHEMLLQQFPALPA